MHKRAKCIDYYIRSAKVTLLANKNIKKENKMSKTTITEDQAIEELTNEIVGEETQATQELRDAIVYCHRDDWNKIADFDDIENIKDDVKGLTVLIDGLIFAVGQGEARWQENAYNVLNNVLFKTIEKLEELQTQVDYMQDVIRAK